MVEETISRLDYDLLALGDLYARLRDTQNAGGAAIARTDRNLM
ncbi:hypothetical protein [Arthrobacter rhombi]